MAGGCLGRSTESVATKTPTTNRTNGASTPPPELPEDLQLVGGRPTVRFPDIADGEVSVTDERIIEYASPVEASFEMAALVEGSEIENESSSDTLRVDTIIPADGPPTLYPAPVYQEDTGFEYRLYANDAFVTMHDWHVAAGTGNVFDQNGAGSRTVAFEPHYKNVYRDVVTADLVPDGEATDPLSLGIVQYPFEQLRAENPDDLTGVMLFGQQGSVPTPIQVPQVSFSFKRDGSTVILTHSGGDTLDAENLVVQIDGTPTAAQWADNHDQVRAGDTLEIDVSDAPDGAMLRLLWETGDTSKSQVLVVFPIR